MALANGKVGSNLQYWTVLEKQQPSYSRAPSLHFHHELEDVRFRVLLVEPLYFGGEPRG